MVVSAGGHDQFVGRPGVIDVPLAPLLFVLGHALAHPDQQPTEPQGQGGAVGIAPLWYSLAYLSQAQAARRRDTEAEQCDGDAATEQGENHGPAHRENAGQGDYQDRPRPAARPERPALAVAAQLYRECRDRTGQDESRRKDQCFARHALLHAEPTPAWELPKSITTLRPMANAVYAADVHRLGRAAMILFAI